MYFNAILLTTKEFLLNAINIRVTFWPTQYNTQGQRGTRTSLLGYKDTKECN